MTPKKSLGQNFLTSIPARIVIVNAGELTKGDVVLEIGPGRGFLTRGLLDSGAKVVALEKDRDLIPVLSEIFAPEIKSGQLVVIEGDALLFEPSTFYPPLSTYKLIANIPYYITGAILSRYLSHKNSPSKMVVLVQKEVAERVVARDKKESILSLSVKVYGGPKLVYRVNKGSFNPIPSVDSAVLQINNISRKNFKNQYHEEMFFKTLHAGFAHKRKFLISNLLEVFKESKNREEFQKLFEELKISEKIRAEDLPLDIWLQISNFLTK
ncbi:TPA: ribosomal RNA small subunit methyltransferase A [Candidatus Nomurabacteria bacterium]|nr:ribosomal RNA small subunit methyltransferase A [Candidatus Nomurabacteria bacterium]